MAKQATKEVYIEQLSSTAADIWLTGRSPLILNSMSAKAKREFIFPSGRKTAAERAQNMKHDPIQEYRDSCYKRKGEGPTRLMFPAAAVKASICNAALEVPGAKKAQIARLVWVVGDYVDLYGVPKIFTTVVRSADMNKTPDVRTRAILPTWAVKVQVQFITPSISDTSIVRLLETAGLVIGLGDFRQEKGKGSYGQFRTADEDEVSPIVKAGGMKQQDAALEKPEYYDGETEELLVWFESEKVKRGKGK